jgi:hypothetical protein
MSFRSLNQRVLEPVAQSVMIFGIIALCQPWVEILHRYGLTITIVGLLGFLITIHIPREEAADESIPS